MFRHKHVAEILPIGSRSDGERDSGGPVGLGQGTFYQLI